MADETSVGVAALYRYPVKGLSAEPLDSVALEPGRPFPWDRAYAIENGPSGFDAHRPEWLPKSKFLMLMRDERLAKLESRFEPSSGRLTILREGKPVVAGNLDDALGRRLSTAAAVVRTSGPRPGRTRSGVRPTLIWCAARRPGR